jgi:hypothetical protein
MIRFVLDNPFLLVSRIAGESNADYWKRMGIEKEIFLRRHPKARQVADANVCRSGELYAEKGVDVAYFSTSIPKK